MKKAGRRAVGGKMGRTQKGEVVRGSRGRAKMPQDHAKRLS